MIGDLRQGGKVTQRQKLEDFERLIIPQLPAAYNLARWLARRDADAEDVVQEAFLRAYKFFDGFHGGDSRAWVLMIVRNTCYTWLRQNRMVEQPASFDDELNETAWQDGDPEAWLERSANLQLLDQALAGLPVEFREVIA